MSTLSQFGGGMPVTKAIVNNCSYAGWSTALTSLVNGAMQITAGAKGVASGSMTAATLKTILSVTGRGVIDLFGFTVVNATSRTVRAKITIDGVVVLDSTSAAITTANQGGAFIGGGSSNNIAVPDPVYFNQSLLIEMASSLTETDMLNIAYRYKTF